MIFAMNVTTRSETNRRYNSSEKGKARTKAFRQQRKDAGICLGCQEPAVTELYCTLCAEKMRLRVSYGISAADYNQLTEEDSCPNQLLIMSGEMQNTQLAQRSRCN